MERLTFPPTQGNPDLPDCKAASSRRSPRRCAQRQETRNSRLGHQASSHEFPVSWFFFQWLNDPMTQ
jgi:hypothetical protein